MAVKVKLEVGEGRSMKDFEPGLVEEQIAAVLDQIFKDEDYAFTGSITRVEQVRKLRHKTPIVVGKPQPRNRRIFFAVKLRGKSLACSCFVTIPTEVKIDLEKVWDQAIQITDPDRHSQLHGGNQLIEAPSQEPQEFKTGANRFDQIIEIYQIVIDRNEAEAAGFDQQAEQLLQQAADVRERNRILEEKKQKAIDSRQAVLDAGESYDSLLADIKAV